MGLRPASVRHSNVVVMAPALTETAQSQNFELTSPSKTVHLPLSLKNYKKKKGTYPKEDSPNAEPKISNGDDSSLGMNGHTPPEITYSINGLAKSLKNEFMLIEKKENKTTDPEKENIESTKSLEVKPVNKPATGVEGTDYTLTQIGGFMMNNSYSPMGDNSETMGLQKSNEDLTETDSGAFSKEKITPGEMDQLFKNLGVAIANEDLASTGELSSQNVEEILQAIDSMEGNGGDVCPPEINQLETGAGDAMFSISEAGDISGFERDLFNVVDVMNICVDETLTTVNKDADTEERVDEMVKRECQLVRKVQFLSRRLHKIQARALGKHVAEEITGVIEYTNNMLEAANRTRGYGVSDMSETEVSDLRVEPKGASLSSLSLLMRQLDHAATQQASALARSNTSRQCKYFGSGSTNNHGLHVSNGMRQGRPGSVLPPFKTEVKIEMEQVAGELHSQLSMVQAEIDSDVTASSSGCESCDEFINYNNQHQHKLTISKRAAWKFAEERAAIASRCTWLQAQMADLEYKIRQQTEIMRQLRLAKGAVRLAEVPANPESTSHSPLQSNQNGYSTDESSSSSGGSTSGGCCRTRPLIRSSFGKRKLVEAWSLAGRLSKKVTRPGSIVCSCRPQLQCLLCAGSGSVQSGSPSIPPALETVPVNERLAALDPSFHPVLSFQSDASQSLHYDSILKCAEWQARAVRIPGKVGGGGHGGGGGGTVVGAVAAREAAAATDLAHRRIKKHHPNPHNPAAPTPQPATAATTPSTNHRNKTPSSMSISAKLKRKIVRGRRRRNPSSLPFERFRQRKKPRVMQDGENRGGNIENEAVYDVSDTGNRFSPVPSPTPSKDPKDQFRRKRENSYDIDNIVIPYSIAASTRPEKLNYKEIQTPKWRRVKDEPSENADHKNGLKRRSSHENEQEDVSDEAVILRHDRCEVDEKKKFLSYLKLPNSSLGRNRSQRRTDSRAESSGANTPDPMSPATRDGGETSNAGGPSEGFSPLTSPPVTPLAEPPPPSASPSEPTAASPAPMGNSRRRTVSQSKPEPSKSPPLHQEPYETVAPYERRIFPLSEEVYHKMLSENDSGHYSVIGNHPPYNKHYEEVTPSRAGSPSSFSTDSADSYLMEDPNDPEWTMSQVTQESKR